MEDIEFLIGKVGLIAFDISCKGIPSATVALSGYLKSPGLKYKHYAPHAEVVIVEGSTEDVQKKIRSLADEALKDNKKVGIISFQKNARYKDCIVIFAGSDAYTVAKRLFSVLREMDKKKVDIIISESLIDKGIGLAVSDRLKRAASYNIIKATAIKGGIA
jgi:L-threonylcarbamoyladenylate synthase